MEPNRANYRTKVRKNQIFIKAVDYLIQTKMIDNLKCLAERAGISNSTLSNIRSDKKIVADKTIYKLLDAFPGVFNPDYFSGDDREPMLAADLAKEPATEPAPQAVDYSFLIEKAVEKATAYADKTIALLESQLADKEEIIALLKQRIASLEAERQIYDRQQPLRDYPFPVGVAEGKDKDTIRV